MDKLVKYIKGNISVSDAELEYTIEKMTTFRCPISLVNTTLYENILDLCAEYSAETNQAFELDDSDIEDILYQL
jgi:hypothetical protein